MSAALLEKNTAPIPAGEDDVSLYLAMIRQFPRLSPEEEREVPLCSLSGIRSCSPGAKERKYSIYHSGITAAVHGIFPGYCIHLEIQADPERIQSSGFSDRALHQLSV